MKGFSGLLVALLVLVEVQSFIFEDDGGTRFCSRDIGFYRQNKQLEGSCSIDRNFGIVSSRRMDRGTSPSSRERRFIQMNEFGRFRKLERIPDASLNEIQRNDRSLSLGRDTRRINEASTYENRLNDNREVRSSRSDIRNSRIQGDRLKSIRNANEGERRETIASFRNSRKSIEPSEMRAGRVNFDIRDGHIRSNRKTDNMRQRGLDTQGRNFQRRYNSEVSDYNNKISTNSGPVDSRFSPASRGSMGKMNKNRETRKEINKDFSIGNVVSIQRERTQTNSRSERFSVNRKSFPTSKYTEEKRSSIPPSQTNRDVGKINDEMVPSRRNSRSTIKSSADNSNSDSRVGRNQRTSSFRKDIPISESIERRSSSITPSDERTAQLSIQNRFITTRDDKTRTPFRSVSRVDENSLFVRNDGRRSLERLREFGNDRRQRQNTDKKEISNMNRVHDIESRSFRENVRRHTNTVSARRVTESRETTTIYKENLSNTRLGKLRNMEINERISEHVRNLQRDNSRMVASRRNSRSMTRSSDDIQMVIPAKKPNDEYNSNTKVARNERVSSPRNDASSSDVRRSSSIYPSTERISSSLFVKDDGRRSLKSSMEFGNDKKQVQNSGKRYINTPKEDKNRVHRSESRSSRGENRRQTNTISARREPKRIDSENMSDSRREKGRNIEVNRRSSESSRIVQRDTLRINEVTSSRRNDVIDISARKQKNVYNSNSRVERNEGISSYRRDVSTLKATERKSSSVSSLNERITHRSTGYRFVDTEAEKTKNLYKFASRMGTEVNRRGSEEKLHWKNDAERMLQLDISRMNNLPITRARSSISSKRNVINGGNEFRQNSRELEIPELQTMAVFSKTHRDISQRILDKGIVPRRGQMLNNLGERNERSIRPTEDTSRRRDSRGLYNLRMQKSSYETENKSSWSKRNVEMGAIHSSGKPDDYWHGIHLALASILLGQLIFSRKKTLKTGCVLKNWIEKVQIF